MSRLQSKCPRYYSNMRVIIHVSNHMFQKHPADIDLFMAYLCLKIHRNGAMPCIQRFNSVRTACFIEPDDAASDAVYRQ
jgi:hypothetical protein